MRVYTARMRCQKVGLYKTHFPKFGLYGVWTPTLPADEYIESEYDK